MVAEKTKATKRQEWAKNKGAIRLGFAPCALLAGVFRGREPVSPAKKNRTQNPELVQLKSREEGLSENLNSWLSGYLDRARESGNALIFKYPDTQMSVPAFGSERRGYESS
jgi:hypothetical protein